MPVTGLSTFKKSTKMNQALQITFIQLIQVGSSVHVYI